MAPLSVHRLFQLGCLAYLLLSAFLCATAAVSVDLSEQRNKVAKIKVNPRGNLWATGHFMGKKSLPDSQVLEYPEEAAAVNSIPCSPALFVEDMKDLLIRELLKIPLQQRQLDESRVKFDLNDQASGLLMKILEKYVENSRK
ncbi:neuromedin-B [Ambystoma mexicanum]|uniref:neuromedin-B n=1 Tax=Ambystoma mexicanum TaxID=8296 RepID=UPI0037E73F3D